MLSLSGDDTWRAALRPTIRPQCWFLPLSWVCPAVIPNQPPHVSEDDAHGSKDRAKDAFCRAHATISRACAGACASARMRTTFPSSATSGHPLSSARPTSREDTRETNGPTEARLPTSPREEWRLPQDQDAFDRHDARRSYAERGIPPAFAPALSLTPPAGAVSGTDLHDGHCKVTVRSPAEP